MKLGGKCSLHLVGCWCGIPIYFSMDWFFYWASNYSRAYSISTLRPNCFLFFGAAKCQPKKALRKEHERQHHQPPMGVCYGWWEEKGFLAIILRSDWFNLPSRKPRKSYGLCGMRCLSLGNPVTHNHFPSTPDQFQNLYTMCNNTIT